MSIFHSSLYHNITRLRKNFDDPQVIEAIKFYQDQLNVKVNTWYEHKNTFVIDMVVLPENVAILVQKNFNSNIDGSMNYKLKIKQNILKAQGWEVIIHDSLKMQELPF